MQWLCLLKDHQLGGCPFWANLVLADHKVHGYPYKAGVSCVDKGALEEGLWSMCPLQAARALGEGMSQTPERDDRGPSKIDGFAIRRPMEPKAKSALPRLMSSLR